MTVSLEAYRIRVGLFASVQLRYHSSVEQCGISPVQSRSECLGTGSLRLTLLTFLCLASAILILHCGGIHPHPGPAQGENGQPGSTLLSLECSPCAGQVCRTCPLCATQFREESALWRITVRTFVPHVLSFMLEGGNFVVVIKALANLVVEVG